MERVWNYIFVFVSVVLAVAPVVASASNDYTFERIDVPGVDFLAVTASSDFENYAGYTLSPDGEKIVGFTLIDGVFDRPTISPARRTPISMRSVTVG